MGSRNPIGFRRGESLFPGRIPSTEDPPKDDCNQDAHDNEDTNTDSGKLSSDVPHCNGMTALGTVVGRRTDFAGALGA